MSLVKSVGRRAARRVARRVHRLELFEQPGERDPTPPLPESPTDRRPEGQRASSGGEEEEADAEASGAPGEAPAQAPAATPGGRASALVDEAALEAALTPRGRALIVHHWATWCEPCEDELPRIEALARQAGAAAEVVGLSWELFDSPASPDGALEAVQAYAERAGLSWPTLVFNGQPEALFEALELDYRKIPQTRVIGPDGACLEELHGPLSEADLPRLLALVGAS